MRPDIQGVRERTKDIPSKAVPIGIPRVRRDANPYADPDAEAIGVDDLADFYEFDDLTTRDALASEDDEDDDDGN